MFFNFRIKLILIDFHCFSLFVLGTVLAKKIFYLYFTNTLKQKLKRAVVFFLNKLVVHLYLFLKHKFSSLLVYC